MTNGGEDRNIVSSCIYFIKTSVNIWLIPPSPSQQITLHTTAHNLLAIQASHCCPLQLLGYFILYLNKNHQMLMLLNHLKITRHSLTLFNCFFQVRKGCLDLVTHINSVSLLTSIFSFIHGPRNPEVKIVVSVPVRTWTISLSEGNKISLARYTQNHCPMAFSKQIVSYVL